MKLFITRSQTQATFGGVNFELYTQVEPSQEEQALIQKYKMQNV